MRSPGAVEEAIGVPAYNVVLVGLEIRTMARNQKWGGTDIGRSCLVQLTLDKRLHRVNAKIEGPRKPPLADPVRKATTVERHRDVLHLALQHGSQAVQAVRTKYYNHLVPAHTPISRRDVVILSTACDLGAESKDNIGWESVGGMVRLNEVHLERQFVADELEPRSQAARTSIVDMCTHTCTFLPTTAIYFNELAAETIQRRNRTKGQLETRTDMSTPSSSRVRAPYAKPKQTFLGRRQKCEEMENGSKMEGRKRRRILMPSASFRDRRECEKQTVGHHTDKTCVTLLFISVHEFSDVHYVHVYAHSYRHRSGAYHTVMHALSPNPGRVGDRSAHRNNYDKNRSNPGDDDENGKMIDRTLVYLSSPVVAERQTHNQNQGLLKQRSRKGNPKPSIDCSAVKLWLEENRGFDIERKNFVGGAVARTTTSMPIWEGRTRLAALEGGFLARVTIEGSTVRNRSPSRKVLRRCGAVNPLSNHPMCEYRVYEPRDGVWEDWRSLRRIIQSTDQQSVNNPLWPESWRREARDRNGLACQRKRGSHTSVASPIRIRQKTAQVVNSPIVQGAIPRKRSRRTIHGRRRTSRRVPQTVSYGSTCHFNELATPDSPGWNYGTGYAWAVGSAEPLMNDVDLRGVGKASEPALVIDREIFQNMKRVAGGRKRWFPAGTSCRKSFGDGATVTEWPQSILEWHTTRCLSWSDQTSFKSTAALLQAGNWSTRTSGTGQMIKLNQGRPARLVSPRRKELVTATESSNTLLVAFRVLFQSCGGLLGLRTGGEVDEMELLPWSAKPETELRRKKKLLRLLVNGAPIYHRHSQPAQMQALHFCCDYIGVTSPNVSSILRSRLSSRKAQFSVTGLICEMFDNGLERISQVIPLESGYQPKERYASWNDE
ncbi:hypothetical protein FA15DRAFT_729851 [Coprinopsis marcescibilis]|uniref:Uncharacterized protein n=1 Tax=Coprinopsis marcescibilis TaxID=230819 RepID=A0A5C3KE96_COPMA|nr:hypothetical protein FA15DRAFT_729851 [Coprinopsis marcescibilis]